MLRTSAVGKGLSHVSLASCMLTVLLLAGALGAGYVLALSNGAYIHAISRAVDISPPM